MPTVLITGASAGIGRALALEYSKQGWNVIVAARRMDRLTALAQSLPSATAVRCDVTVRSDLDHAVAEGVRHFGAIDTVIANAGFGVAEQIQNLSLEDYRRQFETNILGVISTAQASASALQKSQGKIGIIGSVMSYISMPGISPYSMSKAAVKSFAEALYFEWNSLGVGVTLVCPGFVESEIRKVNNQGLFVADAPEPVRKFWRMSAEVAARQIYRAVEGRRREVVITWHARIAILAVRAFPGLFAALVKTFRVHGRKSPGT